VRALAGLSLPEWRVIAHLAVMGEQSASALSSAALIDRAEVSRAVALLTRKGMIGKRPNVRNRRSQLLHLTPEGQAVFDRVHDRRRRFFQMITSDLDEKELAVFDALLLRMACRAGQIERAGVSALDTL
jgi:DNA-binding MarR family transcriptional regulator